MNENAQKYQKFLDEHYKHLEDKIFLIIKDSNNAYNSNRFSEFIRLEYLLIEKMAALTQLNILKIHKLEENKEINLDEILNFIEKVKNQKFIDYEQLNYWRNIRNKVVHENFKVDKQMSDKAKLFFEDLHSNLKNISKD